MTKLDKVINEIKTEIELSNKKFKLSFNSNQEWLGTLREEYIEFEEEIFNSKEVWKGNPKIKKEAIQVAAMAIKGILSLC